MGKTAWRPRGLRRSLLATTAGVASLAALAGHAALAQDEGEEAERIVVTGSYIPRSTFSQSSPVAVYDSEEINALAPVSVADFFQDLPYTSGSAFQTGRAVGSEEGNGTINLRGLGASATLVLVNSRRHTQNPQSEENVVDVNTLVPEIMIGRVEILKDGASATYGSDAVSGVVNFITRDDFSGVEALWRSGVWDYSHAWNHRLEVMGGTDLSDSTHVVGALSFYTNDPMHSTGGDAPQQEPLEFDARMSSSRASPGNIVVPTRDAGGAISGQMTIPDPECGNIASSFVSRGACRYQFWSDNSLQADLDRYQAFGRLLHDFGNDISFTGEAAYARMETAVAYTAGDVANAAVPGHAPGVASEDAYRARNANGDPLYAVSSGVSAGYSLGGMEIFLPLRDSNGDVVLTGDPTNPASGIPFWEDVQFTGRPTGSQGALPTGNALGPGEYAHSRLSYTENDVYRLSGELAGDLDSVWSWQTGLTWSRHELRTDGAPGNAHMPRYLAAVQGLGGPSCTGSVPGANGCEYFNVMGNRTFATGAGDPRANTAALRDYVLPTLSDSYESSLLVADALLTGELGMLPAGPIGVAVGVQVRDASLAVDYDQFRNDGAMAIGGVPEDFDESITTSAAFGEAIVPLFDNASGALELNAAIRYEEAEGQSTTDPKIGLLYTSPDSSLRLRGSYGTSFVAPSLFRLFAVSGSAAAVDDCPVGYHPACTGEVNLRINELTVGNPDLKPETSTAYSAGFEWEPIDNLTLSADWWSFDYEDQVLTENTDDLVLADPDGSLTGRVVRDANGQLVSVATTYFNAAKVTTEGLDFGVDYFVDLGADANFALAVDGTYISEYEYQASAGATPVSVKGSTNDLVPVPPNTDLRVNVRGTYSFGASSVSAILHHYGEMDWARGDETIDAWTPIDLSYTHRFDAIGLADGGVDFTIGANNVLQDSPEIIPFPSFQPFVASLWDLRGRMIYASVRTTF